ncbi:potassium channel family protein [Polycladidibacter hongkongensis]|uniref:potassium channel family protein n=1 Tax=Polycladidibacter hongkongensis TaxID=1647556 RepID=UPI00082DA51C|nr:potassium channel family protein [Pseudovibrio hongkongensis]
MQLEEQGWRTSLRRLYFGADEPGQHWRIALLLFDLVTVCYFLVSSLIDLPRSFIVVDYVIGAILLCDLLARLIISIRPLRALLSFHILIDVLVIISLFAALYIENLGFLRVVRMLRLLRSYHVLKELREHFKWFKRHEDIISSSMNLLVFIFVVSAVVFVLEVHVNPSINNFFDALYFTVTTLTTTGYGDITMTDSVGRLLTILIMVFGVALFLRLVQTIFRPQKIKVTCKTCGLKRHDPDAVHCKHCGATIHIPNEGDTL